MQTADVITALEYLISGECCDNQFDYLDEIHEAIKLLRNQESDDDTPHIITYGNMKNIGGILWSVMNGCIWLENIFGYLAPVFCLEYNPGDEPGDGLFHFRDVNGHSIYQNEDEYMKQWRCWTHRPSDIQREKEIWKT